MIESQFANKLSCLYCGKTHGADRWPIGGDSEPFYFQREPGEYSVAVTCPHCRKVWYVVWDYNPGPIPDAGRPHLRPASSPTQATAPEKNRIGEAKPEKDAIRWIVATCFRFALADETWRQFGFSKRPRHGSLFQRFRPRWKVDLETTLIREMVITAAAFHIVLGHGEIQGIAEHCTSAPEFVRAFHYASRSEAVIHLRESIQAYVRAGLDQWHRLLHERLSPESIPDSAVGAQVLAGCAKLATFMHSSVSLLKLKGNVAATDSLRVPGGAAKTEKPGPTSFSSAMEFDVHVRDDECVGAFVRGTYLGTTPLDKSVVIPPDREWAIKPCKSVEIRKLPAELLAGAVPGLLLAGALDHHLTCLEGLSSLERLDLSASHITDAGLAHLRGLSGLQELVLSYAKVTDAGVAHLRSLPRLRRLNLEGTQITDAGLVHVQCLRGLQILDLGSTGVSEAGLEHLTELKDLRGLGLEWLKATGAGLSPLRHLRSLQRLDLSNWGGRAPSYLRDMMGLQELHLGGTLLEDDDMQFLKHLVGLRKLNLICTGVRDAGMAYLGVLPSLQFLDISDTPVGDAGLEHLAALPSLRSLDISSTHIGDDGLEHIRDMVGLQELWLQHTRVTDAGVSCLNRLRKLQRLTLAGLKITNEGLAHLRGLTGMRTLSISCQPVTDAGLIHLTEFKELRRLALCGTQTTGNGLRHLAGCAKTLQDLDLSGTNVTDAELVHLKGFKELKRLALRGTQITGNGLRHLTGCSRVLQHLDLSRTNVTDAGLKHLPDLDALQYLHLDRTQVTDACMDGLTRLRRLRYLGVLETGVTQSGAAMLRATLADAYVRQGKPESWEQY